MHVGWSITSALSALLLAATAGRTLADGASWTSREELQPIEQQARRVTAAIAQYAVPPVTLVRDDGKAVTLPEEMNDGRAVVLNFVFTSCGSTCPLMSQVLAQFQRKLGPAIHQVHLMSISIDPEEDTPARLAEYARKFATGSDWQYYTGTLEASITTQRAFDVYRGDKMSHIPVTLMRLAPGQPWRRIDGILTPDDLLSEYLQLRVTK